jgi:hypothetical protein
MVDLLPKAFNAEIAEIAEKVQFLASLRDLGVLGVKWFSAKVRCLKSRP